jgi:hypothetical protein
MKVFLGWSGEISHKVALALSDWLPKVIQAVKPFVSSEDIAKGARWSLAIAKELQASSFGIICVTKENSESAWINFEAGALSREIETSLVTPFLFNLREAEIEGPLKQFQVVINEKSDILKLLTSINGKQGENRLEETNLRATFEMWWPKLNEKLESIQNEVGKTPARQTIEMPRMVEELLELARMQQREMSALLDRNNKTNETRFMKQMSQLEQVGTTLSALTRSVESLYGTLQQRSQVVVADLPVSLPFYQPGIASLANGSAAWGTSDPPSPAVWGTSPISPPTGSGIRAVGAVWPPLPDEKK